MVRKKLPSNSDQSLSPSSPQKVKTRKTPINEAKTEVSQELGNQIQDQSRSSGDSFKPSPDLFANGSSTRMASALPIWEASNILAQRSHLPWKNDPDGKLRYAKDIADGQGAIHFWVTEDLENDYPVSLAGAAAFAVIDTFDIRAACMHLIYAAHATQLVKPWEQELVIDDRQIEAYLGLKKRTDLNRQQKLALIEEIAKQPCKITTFISYPNQGKVKGFTLEEGRLWHLLGTRYHYQHDLLGNKELVGMTFIIRAGLWAKYFLNEEGRLKQGAHYQYGILSRTLLESVMSTWQHREGAARLMLWLLFKAHFDCRYPLSVQTLMEVAYGREKVQQARQNSDVRKRLAYNWDEDLLTLHERGWSIQFDPNSYSTELQPAAFGRTSARKPRGFFEQLLSAYLWITPTEALIQEIDSSIQTDKGNNTLLRKPENYGSLLNGAQVKELRLQKGWSQRKLSTLTGISQGLISLIENGERNLTSENADILQEVFGLASTSPI